MSHHDRPWTAYLLRILSSTLMFITSYALLSGSTFALRMREDLPIQLIVLILGAVLSYLPLLAGRRYLGALLISAFLLSGIGGYWWTTIPWDELIKDSGFPTPQPPTFLDHALTASPPLVAAFYAVASRPSLLRTDLKTRGIDPTELRTATLTSFLAGTTLLTLCTALAAILWLLLTHLPTHTPIPTGIPALFLVAAIAGITWALLAHEIVIPRARGLDRGITSRWLTGARSPATILESRTRSPGRQHRKGLSGP